MAWLDRLSADPLPWLLESDPSNPAIRFFALTQLAGHPEDDPEVREARRAVMATGPVPAMLAQQAPEGYWVEPGPGYAAKYRGTIWQVIFLAQLGADGDDERVRAGCDYVLEYNRSSYGGFSFTGTPAGMIHCIQGNLCAALLDLGFWGDARLAEAVDWLARSVTGEGIAPAVEARAPVRYFLSGNCAPGFACAANNRLPCAWGAVKVMLAMGKVSSFARTPAVRSAIEMGIHFLLGHDPAVADYPAGYADKPSSSWFKLGYPIGYVTDVLQNLDALAGLGCAADARMTPALEWLLGKQDPRGQWKLEYTYNGKTWADVEEKGAPSKWVTLRALRVLRAADRAE